MLAFSITLLQAHGGHERPGRMAMAINAERAARRPPARPIGRRVRELASPIDGSQRAMMDNDVLACLLVSYMPLALAAA